jgi:apolipoprotein N-acyltransferase
MTLRDPHLTRRRRGDPAALRQQRRTALSLAMAFVVVLLLVQLGLLVGVVEGVVGGEGVIAFPATLVSGVCCLGTWWLRSLLRQRER